MVRNLTNSHQNKVAGALLALTLGLASCGSQSPVPAGTAEQPAAAGLESAALESAGLEPQRLDAGTNNLSVEPFVSVTNGWGPVERDRSNGEQAEGDGRALTVGGRAFARGFGTHAGSSLTFDLGGRCATFTASVGVDDEVGDRGSVVFQVYADGTRVYDSGKMTGADGARAVQVSVAGKKELRLVATDAGDGTGYDHADWLTPSLLGCVATVAAPAPGAVATPAKVAYSGPITITRGGTYSGNWESTENRAAILIRTSEPVVIENSNIRSRGHLISGFGYNLTVRNVRGENLDPGITGKAKGRAISAEEVLNLRVENSSFTGGGIYVRQFRGDAAQGQGVRILRNTFSNIDGRESDGQGGYSGTEYRQAVQFNDVTQIPTAEIAWNQVVNEPGRSAVEDNISLFISSGTPDRPILIHDNYIQGAYPPNPATARDYSGGGIMLGDGKVTDPARNGYAHAYDNIVVGTTNYGMAISGGVGNRVERNRVVSSGRLPDGTRIPTTNVGLYLWDIWNAGSLAPATFARNVMRDNASGWTKVGANGRTSNNHMWLPNCSLNGTSCEKNSSLGTQSLASERAEWTRWQQKLGAAGVRVGAQ